MPVSTPVTTISSALSQHVPGSKPSLAEELQLSALCPACMRVCSMFR